MLTCFRSVTRILRSGVNALLIIQAWLSDPDSVPIQFHRYFDTSKLNKTLYKPTAAAHQYNFTLYKITYSLLALKTTIILGVNIIFFDVFTATSGKGTNKISILARNTQRDIIQHADSQYSSLFAFRPSFATHFRLLVTFPLNMIKDSRQITIRCIWWIKLSFVFYHLLRNEFSECVLKYSGQRLN